MFVLYRSSVRTSFETLLTTHFCIHKTIECHIQIIGTSDDPVHLSLWNMRSSLMTRLATLSTNSSCMTKAIRCHKRQPHFYATNQ